MYLEHFHLTHTPFLEEPDINLFYPSGEREAVYQALLGDIIIGKPLIKFIGKEGSGKTLICKMIAANVPADHDVVYIDNPIGSFDDLLRIICLDLGMNPGAGNEGAKFIDELSELINQRKETGRKILIIIDEAEKLFLATLERLVRTICETEEASTLRILLAGRLGLDANLEQLSIYCANVDINAGYFLEPLTEEDTGEYLKYRMEAAGLAPNHQDEIFSEGAVAKIHASSQGNIRMINILAEEALQNSCTDKSFMVLLDHVDVEEGEDNTSAGALLEKVQVFISRAIAWCVDNKKIAGAGAGALLLVVMIIMLAGGDDTAQQAAQQNIESPRPIELEEDVVEPPVIVEEEPEVITPVIKPIQPVVEKEPEVQLEDEVVETEVVVQDLEEIAPEQVEEPLETVVVQETVEMIPEPVKEKPVENVLSEEPYSEESGYIVVGPESKKKAVGINVQNIEQVDLPPKKEMASQVVIKSPLPVNGRNGELLFRERRRASASWLAEAFRGGYTIQLMMLSSNQAEYNLKKMLMKDPYYKIRDQLYILRKKTTPPTLFVYYGIYKSMDEAREIRNTMAVFLRKHHPYALSISDALKKTED